MQAEIDTIDEFERDPERKPTSGWRQDEDRRHLRGALRLIWFKGILVNYKAAEKYTGSDEFDLLVLYPHGTAWEIHYNISVR
jgi:hypothetical protein